MSNITATAKKPSKGFSQRKKTLLLLSMVAPGAIWLFLLRYIPMMGIVIAFKNYKVYTPSPSLINNIIHSEWVGFKNFKFIFVSTQTWEMIRNTIGYNALWIVMGLVISVSFAVMLNEITRKFLAKTYQTLMFFPYFLSWVVASYFVLAFLDPTRGLVTHMQMNQGVVPTNWYNDPKPWPYILTLASMWKNIGYSTILYLAAITGIDSSQYEAAAIDGASKLQQVRFITIPHLKPIITILFIMNVGKIFNADFGLFWSVPKASGPLIPTTQVIDTYVYRVMSITKDLGMGAAAGFLQMFVGFICILVANTIVRKIDNDNSLF